MSAYPDPDTNLTTIYISLLDEGVDVVRPTQGVSLGGNVFRILPTPDYDPKLEDWQFLPGSVVRCIQETWDGGKILVARELVQ